MTNLLNNKSVFFYRYALKLHEDFLETSFCPQNRTSAFSFMTNHNSLINLKILYVYNCNAMGHVSIIL